MVADETHPAWAYEGVSLDEDLKKTTQ